MSLLQLSNASHYLEKFIHNVLPVDTGFLSEVNGLCDFRAPSIVIIWRA